MLLRVKVRSDATSCLDLVLRHAGLDYRALCVEPDGASLLVEAPDCADVAHIVAVLRQHLGVVLRCVMLDGAGPEGCLVHEPDERRNYCLTDAAATAGRLAP